MFYGLFIAIGFYFAIIVCSLLLILIKFMNLTKDFKDFAGGLNTPFLLVDLDIVREKYRKIKDSFEGVRVYYAIKANPEERIIEVLKEEGAGFEIASSYELNLLLKKGVDPSNIICSNPIKKDDFLKEAHQKGVDFFAFDSSEEVDKMASFAPGSNVYVRLEVDNIGSEWPLTKKFGVGLDDAVSLLLYSKEKGLNPCGITFHVGSQCLNKDNWKNALLKTKEVFDMMAKKGIELKVLNMGGGLPIKHTHEIPEIEEIGGGVNNTIKDLFAEDVKVMIEPGRSVVGDAGSLVTTIIGKAKRKNTEWLFLDIGVFHGLMETVGGIDYEVLSDKKGKTKKFMLAGPSCDGFDKMFSCNLPSDLQVGDRLYFLNAAAYTTCYNSNFNGLDSPKTFFIK